MTTDTEAIVSLMEKLGSQMDRLPLAVCLPALVGLLLAALKCEIEQGHMAMVDLERETERVILAMRSVVRETRAAARPN